MPVTKKAKAPQTPATPAKSFSLISDDTLRGMYAAMLGCRVLEERSANEGGNPPLPGQEAVIVGASYALRPDDTITAPGSEVIFRMPPKNAAAKKLTADPTRDVIAFVRASGGQLTVGAGVALAAKDHAAQRVVMAFGDPVVESLASWHEALQLAGKYQLPIIFVLRPPAPGPATDNEGPAKAVEASIRERAALAGVMTMPVDRNDAVAIYRVSYESIARARKSTGATLILCTRYQVDGQEPNEPDDPIARMEAYLAAKGLFSAKWKSDLMKLFG